MKIFKRFYSELVKILKTGGVGVIPTDTIYGLVGSALNKKTVERVYKLRHRNSKKPMIILIGEISDLKKFGINLSHVSRKLVVKFWPNKISIIFDCPQPKFRYLHHGTKTLAFRLPKDKKLQAFLKKTGPLVAPSVNFEGQSPAKTIKEAQKYFGDKVNFYVDAGKLAVKPSKLISIIKGKIEYLRK